MRKLLFKVIETREILVYSDGTIDNKLIEQNKVEDNELIQVKDTIEVYQTIKSNGMIYIRSREALYDKLKVGDKINVRYKDFSTTTKVCKGSKGTTYRLHGLTHLYRMYGDEVVNTTLNYTYDPKENILLLKNSKGEDYGE